MSKKLNLTGQRFGRLIVIKESGKNKWGYYKWKCKCDCGNIVFVIGSCLKSGGTKSCGCYQKEKATKHGLRNHPLFMVWQDMKRRCYNKKYKSYSDYGGRGIKVCDEWLNNFKTFYDFCITNGWKKGLCIDRENNNGDYNPNNCRFVRHKENNQNTRQSKIWVVNGKEYPSSPDAAKNENVSVSTICFWCGTKGSHGEPPKAKPGCYAYNKYQG